VRLPYVFGALTLFRQDSFGVMWKGCGLGTYFGHSYDGVTIGIEV
jgi:hypothetical protein